MKKGGFIVFATFRKELKQEFKGYNGAALAKDAMAAMLSNPQIVDGVTEEGEPVWGAPIAIAKTSVTLANLLVDELKKTQEKK